MKHPPYQLRPNKAVDRLLLIDLVGEVFRSTRFTPEEFSYYGFGGPFLDDFRAIHQHFPQIPLTSIERNKSTHERQKFHKFSKNIHLWLGEMNRFISQEYSPGPRDIFWLDFTDFKYPNFETLSQLIPKLGKGSIIKVTFPSQVVFESRDYRGINDTTIIEMGKEALFERFRRRFEKVLPPDFEQFLEKRHLMAELIVNMVRNCVEALTLSDDLSVFPLFSARYSDNMPMVSVTMLVGGTDEKAILENSLADWPFIQMKWSAPILVDLPILSIQERLRLERFLPTKARPARHLSRALGYLVDSDDARNQSSLDQYADFQRYYPLFARVDV